MNDTGVDYMHPDLKYNYVSVPSDQIWLPKIDCISVSRSKRYASKSKLMIINQLMGDPYLLCLFLFRRMPKPATISAATIRFHILATLTTGLIGEEITEKGD